MKFGNTSEFDLGWNAFLFDIVRWIAGRGLVIERPGRVALRIQVPADSVGRVQEYCNLIKSFNGGIVVTRLGWFDELFLRSVKYKKGRFTPYGGRSKFDLFIRAALLASLVLSAYGFGNYCADMYVLGLDRVQPSAMRAFSAPFLPRAPVPLPVPK